MIALKEANYLGQVEQLIRLDGIIASVTTYPDIAHAENLHYHDTLHLSVVLQGGNLEKRKQYGIERLPGTVTYYDAGELHHSTCILPYSRHLNLEILNDFINRYDISPDASVLSAAAGIDNTFLLIKFYKELIDIDNNSLLSCESLTLELLNGNKKKSPLFLRPPWVNQVEEILQDCWNEKLTLKELSVVAGLHPANLSAYFRRYFGCTLGDYRRKLKIKRSLGLVANTTESFAAISFDCDFADQSHFIRTFREYTNWTPKAYRQAVAG